MKVIQLKISEVVPYEKNSRKHSDEQVKLIAKSITDFGFNQPILLDQENVIIAGHGRFLAAQSLGLDEVPVCYPARKLTEKEIRALRILDNKLQNDSYWDYENLEGEFEFLVDNDFSLEDWGLDRLRDLFGDVTSGNVDDEWNEMPEYTSEDETARYSIKVNFLTEEHLKQFASLLKQSLTVKTRSCWYPEQKRRDLKQIKVVSEHDNT